MAEIITINDSDVDSLLKGAKPTLLLISNGDDLRSDFSIAFKKAAAEKNNVVFATIAPKTNPGVVERFEIGSKAVLLGLYRGDELVRRSRPWGADVPLTIELLEKAASADAPQPAEVENVVENAVTANAKEQNVVNNKPVHVTDATFQQEVIDYDLPVVVDFWAEWCGPCRMVAPILDKLAEEFAGKLRIAKVDVDANPGLAQHFKIMSIPTIMMLKNRTMVFSQPGALPEPAMRDLFTQLIALEVPAPDDQPVEEEPAQ